MSEQKRYQTSSFCFYCRKIQSTEARYPWSRIFSWSRGVQIVSDPMS
jgi:hypothetical protein